jgi:hypothetical protein
MIQVAATAMRVGVTIEQLAEVELAYPTFTAVGDLEPVATRPGHGTPEQTRALEWEHRAG